MLSLASCTVASAHWLSSTFHVYIMYRQSVYDITISETYCFYANKFRTCWGEKKTTNMSQDYRS